MRSQASDCIKGFMKMLYKDKYRVKSIRLNMWDYSSDGIYYVTVCTKDRKHYLGNINDQKMILSKIGIIAEDCWNEIPRHFKNIRLDEFVIMPNHLHGLILIDNNICNVETCHGMSLQGNMQFNEFSKPISGSLSMTINHFKSAVKRRCNSSNHIYFQWQSGFYEHIVRNDKELNYIREYINNNPIQWKLDQENL